MTWLQRLFRKQRLENDLDRELQYHLERRIADLQAEGIDPQEAARRARLEFGGSEAIKEACRDARGTRWLEDLIHDCRYAFRGLRRSPGFASIAILSLALGIGTNTAVFSLVDAALIKTLPVKDPEQLRVLNFIRHDDDAPFHTYSGYNTRDEQGRLISGSFSYDAFRALQTQVHEFRSVVGFVGTGVLVRAGDWNDSLKAQFVSGNYFDGLGVQAARGRALTEDDDQTGASPVAVITDIFWRERLRLREDVIGQTVYVNRVPVTIVGILPRAFQGLAQGRSQELFLPLSLVQKIGVDWMDLSNPYTWFIQAFGRMRPGVSDSAAAAAITSVWRAQIESYAPGKAVPTTVLNPGARGETSYFLGFNLSAIWMLTAGSALVLAICCVNLANLLLTRGSARSREIAVRLSIGASRGRVVRHLLTESTLLAVAGAGLGILLASPLLNLFLHYLGGQSALSLDARLDWRTLLFTGTACFAATLFFGAMPAWKATRIPVGPALKESQGSGHLITRNPISRSLVVIQMALSMLLLTGAVMLARTFINLATSDTGFAADHLLVFQTDPNRAGYEDAKIAGTYARIRQSLEALPGVSSVALSQVGLLQGSSSSTNIFVPSMGNPAARGRMWSIYCSDSFLQTMGIPLLAGRILNAQDVLGAERVAVVNEAFVRRNFSGVDPLGQIFYENDSPGPAIPKTPPIRVVGVVRDAAYANIRDSVPPTAYLSYLQRTRSSGMTFVLRTSVEPQSLAAPVRATLGSIDRSLPILELRTQEEQIAMMLSRERLLAWLASGFGLLAAILAAIGLYGVVAYAVSRRTQEFGIRLALGATRAHVQWITLRGSVWMIGIGLGIGAISALLLTKYLASILYKVTPQDTFSFSAAALLMIAAGLLTAWIPARRAAHTDPMKALRQE